MANSANTRFLIDPANPPLARAGVYTITNTLNGKQYVGISVNVADRCRAHESGNSGTKLRRAIAKHGRAAFLFGPIYYATNDCTADLSRIEADLITLLNTWGEGGYNITRAMGRVGPYGPEHGGTVSAAMATPASRAKRSAIGKQQWDDPAARARYAALFVQSHSSPEHKEAAADRMKARLADPIALAKWKTGAVSAQAPEVKVRRAAALKRTLAEPAAKAKKHSDGKRQWETATEERKAEWGAAMSAGWAARRVRVAEARLAAQLDRQPELLS